MPVSFPPRPPDATEEERETWRRAMEGPVAVPDGEPSSTKRSIASGPTARAGGGIDARTQRKLERGQIPPERELDLHGYRLREAEEEVEDFVVGAQEAGCRCVLVITGRKLGEAGPEGVLRDNLPGIARGPALRNRVLHVTHAHRRHGGDAAFYLYLRRPER